MTWSKMKIPLIASLIILACIVIFIIFPANQDSTMNWSVWNSMNYFEQRANTMPQMLYSVSSSGGIYDSTFDRYIPPSTSVNSTYTSTAKPVSRYTKDKRCDLRFRTSKPTSDTFGYQGLVGINLQNFEIWTVKQYPNLLYVRNKNTNQSMIFEKSS